MRALSAFALAGSMVAAACGGSGSGTTASTAAGSVKTTMTDSKINVSVPTIASGNVTFDVANTGTVVHSFLILKTDVAQDKIPGDPKDAAKVQELGLVKTTGQIPAGQSKQLVAKLDPGKYVLICNEPAHYQLGMHTGFAVQ